MPGTIGSPDQMHNHIFKGMKQKKERKKEKKERKERKKERKKEINKERPCT
jgi:hypothetical protein